MINWTMTFGAVWFMAGFLVIALHLARQDYKASLRQRSNQWKWSRQAWLQGWIDSKTKGG